MKARAPARPHNERLGGASRNNLRSNPVYSGLANVSLVDHVREPVRSVGALGHHLLPTLEDVHSVSTPLPQVDVTLASSCSFQSCSSGLPAMEHLRSVLPVLHQHEIFLVCHSSMPPRPWRTWQVLNLSRDKRITESKLDNYCITKWSSKLGAGQSLSVRHTLY